jgi:hypothetical protein
MGLPYSLYHVWQEEGKWRDERIRDRSRATILQPSLARRGPFNMFCSGFFALDATPITPFLHLNMLSI